MLDQTAVARSPIPGALSAMDKTMEETFMKFSKSAGTDLALLFTYLQFNMENNQLSLIYGT